MLIDKPRCNFKDCRYCFDGNCRSADRYENCKVTDLHYEIAKLTVDLENAKKEVAWEIFAMIDILGTYNPTMYDEFKKKYTGE